MEDSLYKIGTKLKLLKARWGYPKGKILTLGKFNLGDRKEYRLDSKKAYVWICEKDLIKYCKEEE